MVITGVGGTGVVTVGAILGMAAHLEGKGAGYHRHGRPRAEGRRRSRSMSASRERPEDINAIRASSAGADLVLGCDLVVAGSCKVLSVDPAGPHRGGRQPA